jgi:RNA polymerase sigma factor (sigma-70 family)
MATKYSNIDWDRFSALGRRYVAISERGHGFDSEGEFDPKQRTPEQVQLANAIVTGTYLYSRMWATRIRDYTVTIRSPQKRILTLKDMKHLYTVEDLVSYGVEGLIKNLHNYRVEEEFLTFFRLYTAREMFSRAIGDSRMVNVGLKTLVISRREMFDEGRKRLTEERRSDHEIIVGQVSKLEIRKHVPHSLSARAVAFTLKGNYDSFEESRGDKMLPWVEVLDSGDYADDAVVQKSAWEAFFVALKELDPKEMGYIWGLSTGMTSLEISEHLGLKRANGHNVNLRARAKMRSSLEDWAYEDFF